MLRTMTIVLLALTVPAMAQHGLQPCANTGESSATRRITASYGTPIKAGALPAHWRDLATKAWEHDQETPAPHGIHVTGARKFTGPNATFYLIQVNDDVALFGIKCPQERCGAAYWWPKRVQFVINRERPPAAMPGDEFYIKDHDKYPPGTAALFTSDPFNEKYDLQEECIVELTEKTK